MKNILYLVMVIALTNCASFSKKEFREDYEKLSKTNLNTLNGTYELYPNKKFGSRTSNIINHADLFSQITNQSWKNNDALSKMHYIENEYAIALFFESSTLTIKLLENNKTIREDSIKGKIKKGMFYLDNKFLECNGIPYVFGGCQNNKRRIGITKTGSLIINTAYDNGGAMFLILAAGISYNTSFEFFRI